MSTVFKGISKVFSGASLRTMAKNSLRVQVGVPDHPCLLLGWGSPPPWSPSPTSLPGAACHEALMLDEEDGWMPGSLIPYFGGGVGVESSLRWPKNLLAVCPRPLDQPLPKYQVEVD